MNADHIAEHIKSTNRFKPPDYIGLEKNAFSPGKNKIRWRM
jgi:hypothetical protein